MKVKKYCGNAIENIIKRYTYDKDGRLDSMTYKLNNRDKFLVKHYQYDDLGHVAATTSHSRALDINGCSYNVTIPESGSLQGDLDNGMFTMIDPMCELNYGMTPYSFANNNPINYTDLFGLKTYSWEDFAKNWQNFDVNNDDVELPNVVCIGPKPQNWERVYDESSEGLGRLEQLTNFGQTLDLKYGGSNLSKPGTLTNGTLK